MPLTGIHRKLGEEDGQRRSGKGQEETLKVGKNLKQGDDIGN